MGTDSLCLVAVGTGLYPVCFLVQFCMQCLALSAVSSCVTDNNSDVTMVTMCFIFAYSVAARVTAARVL